MRTKFFLFVHHTTSILAKLSTWCFEHSGDISYSLLVNPSHTDESSEGRNTCMWIYIYIYIYNCKYIYLQQQLMVFLLLGSEIYFWLIDGLLKFFHVSIAILKQHIGNDSRSKSWWYYLVDVDIIIYRVFCNMQRWKIHEIRKNPQSSMLFK